MGCGCNSNFSGESFSKNRYKPYRTSSRKLNAAGRSANDFVLCPKGKCWNGRKCVPCTDGTPDGARKRGKNLPQRIKNNQSRFNSFMGFSSRQTPIVNTKKYGVPDEYYYEFNTSSGRSPINRNDMNVEF